jgi:hypothetical protein
MSLNLADGYFCHTLQGSLTCRKILRHGADGFTSPPNEVLLRIIIDLKINSLRPGLNPRSLGFVARTMWAVYVLKKFSSMALVKGT